MREARFRVAGILGRGLLGALSATWRLRVESEANRLRFRRDGKAVILVFCHEQLLPLVHQMRGRGTVGLVSEHSDGEYIARVIEGMGFGTVRGSSTRGGIQGLKGLIRAARDGHDLALTPDGPRGPARSFKQGALLVAQLTGLPIIPLAAGASAAWRFNSWDGFMVPRPFADVRVAHGEPRWVDRDVGREERDLLSRELGAELNALADRLALPSPDTVER
jgi:lysophospholipid acyltransferase (LPLAT)-like uncharacterized protein